VSCSVTASLPFGERSQPQKTLYFVAFHPEFRGGGPPDSVIYSVKESSDLGGVAVDVDHEIGESGACLHHVVQDNGQVIVNIGLGGVCLLDEV